MRARGHSGLLTNKTRREYECAAAKTLLEAEIKKALPEDYVFLGLTERDIERTRLALGKDEEEINRLIFDRPAEVVVEFLKESLQ
jgi:hypothetical protein